MKPPDFTSRPARGTATERPISASGVCQIIPSNLIEEKDPVVLFKRWYEVPLRMLKGIDNDDGGFVAVAMSCAVYERFVTSLIKSEGGAANANARNERFRSDFELPDVTSAGRVWNALRDGLLHQLMPFQEGKRGALPTWEFLPGGQASAILFDSTLDHFSIEPWLLLDRVLKLVMSRSDLLRRSSSAPWGVIFRFEKG